MDVDAFIARWTAREGGAERANYQMFLTELCDVLGVPRPDPAGAERSLNDYVFERSVSQRDSAGVAAPRRIDLYKKGAFILEAKQSRLPGGPNALPAQLALFPAEPDPRAAARGWDAMMQGARKQAEGYVFLLGADQPAPPFIIVCDVGRCLELYADFSGAGRAYSQFPDRKGFRIHMDDLRRPEVRERLAAVWTDPHSLDPARESARVTREIATRLAAVSRHLEEEKQANPEDVAHFLMRCLFTMFAEDTELLPKESFSKLLEKSVADPAHFALRLTELWSQMEKGVEFSHVIEARVRHFNGGLFKETGAFPLGREEIGELLAASKADWTQVDPAIFGTLLEQALSKEERRRLGAHYTPRAYVQRLVEATVMEPLRADWQAALTKAEAAKDAGKTREAIAILRDFQHQLCATRVLDPACGTGNFLYVSLELMKRLEGEVLQALSDLGDQERMAISGETVDPHQFLGLELNPRAAAIAELVIWIGYLQWHYRNFKTHPDEPILRAFKNINGGKAGGFDAVLTWDGYPVTGVEVKDGKRVETYPNARQPAWPEAEFIVGNPPFIGNKRMRGVLGDAYSDALRRTYPSIPESVDFVMYWWDIAARYLVKVKKLRRFGLVTTNSITQTFNRRVLSKYVERDKAVALVMAIPNHPWTKADRTSAAVRIAMTVVQAGTLKGRLLSTEVEEDLDTDDPRVELVEKEGLIAADLSLGVSVIQASQLLANEDVSHQGVTPLGEGFRLAEIDVRGLGYDADDLPVTIRRYLIGRDLVQRPERRFIIDFYGLSELSARTEYPKLFQIILDKVKAERLTKKRKSYRELYWIYAEPRSTMRSALGDLGRYISTCRTSKHRLFAFVEEGVLPDAKIVAIALNDAAFLAILSSRYHRVWAARTGAWLGVGDDSNYNHSECFAKFPFPVLSDSESRLADLGDELDATRKRVLAGHPDLTLTGLYNVLEKLKAGAELTEGDEDVKQRGLVLILKELHERIDALTAEAYGWPADLTDDEILERLVALNAERAREEEAGHVRWLRPDYQIPRFAKGATAKTGELALGEPVVTIAAGLPTFPSDRYEQPLAVEAALIRAGSPMTAAEIARGFKRGGKRLERRVGQALATLARYGRVSALPDGRFSAKRAA